jgi:16S rRNA (adenine1518-N6/adenine1519-N6)-dimethyltransferase
MPRRPKLGQHFLTDLGYRRRIVDSLSLRPDQLVIEIGAGRGAMTELLSARARRVIALELDGGLVGALKERFRTIPSVDILHGDILSTDLAALCRRSEAEQCFVFGNLPYYITSPIVHHLFRFRACVRAMALLVQREVAHRLTAEPGTRAYGYLSVLAQFYSRPRIILSVPPGAFSPPPKVHSALTGFEIHPSIADRMEKEQEFFLQFVKLCFARKRKSLLNNLAGIHSRQRAELGLSRLGLPRTARAEQLTIDQFVSLYHELS